MPAEKLRLRPWLEREIDNGKTPGLSWVDRDKKIFKVPWKHASRHGWNLEKDASVFRSWAIHSGRYRKQVDKPDPRRWKANFRCALNALPDIREVPNQGVSRGNHAFKVYQMVIKSEKKEVSAKPIKCTTGNRDGEKELQKNSLKETVSKCVVKEAPTLPKTVVFDYSSYGISFDPFLGFIPRNYLPLPHLKDHDYLGTRWADPRPEMRDIGIMANPMIKQEPLSPEERRECGDFHHDDGICGLQTITIKEDSVPSDSEIIDLVDELSSDTSSPSPFDDDFNDLGTNEDSTDSGGLCPSSPSDRRPRLHLDVKVERSEDYGMALGPLTPESTLAILKGIHSVQHGRLGSE